MPRRTGRRSAAAFYVDHPKAWVVASAFGDWAAWVPARMVGVLARQQEQGAGRWFLVPALEYALRAGPVGFVIDLERHQEIERPANTHARRA